MLTNIHQLLRNVRGATAIEYGLIAALIAGAGSAAFTSVGTKLRGTFNNAAAKL
jgi:pilus assembly protein Flp/PilA